VVFSLCKLCDPPQCAQVIIHVILTGERQGKRNRVITIISFIHSFIIRQKSERLWLAAVPNQLARNGDSPSDVSLHLAFFLTHSPASVHGHIDGCCSLFIVLIHLFLFFLLWLSHVACGLHDQGSNPCPLHWKHGLLTTGPPGKSPAYFSGCFLELFTP